MDREELRKRAEERYKLMIERREEYVPWWRDLSFYFAPNRGRFYGSDKPRKGILRKNSRLRTIPDDFAAGIKSGLTSPSRPWFTLTISGGRHNRNERVKSWLSGVQDVMREQMLKTNLYDQIYEVYKEQGVFGTACMLIEEDDEEVFRARALTIGSYAVDADDRGDVNRLARRFDFTLTQLAERFGEENLPVELQYLLKDRKSDRTMYEVHHLIEPSGDYGRTDGVSGSYPYLSLWWLCGYEDPAFLKIGGYEERPFMVPRWRVIDGDLYGREQPGDMGLDDAKTINELENDERAAIKRGVAPPLLVPESLMHGTINDSPGGFTSYSAMTGAAQVLPLYNVQFDHASAMNKRLELIRQLEETFFVNFFRMWTSDMRQGRTATEIQARESEKMYMLGPLIERQMSEMLEPMIARIFGIMDRAGYFPPPPEELQGQDFRAEYTSVLANVQKQTAQSGIDIVMNTVSAVTQLQAGAGIQPDIIDKVDFDELVDQQADMYALPEGIVRSDDAVERVRAQKRQEQARQQQAQQAAAEMQGVAQAAPQMAQAAKTAGETMMPGGGSVLDGLMGM